MPIDCNTGLQYKAVPRLREWCKQVEAEMVSNSNKPGNGHIDIPCTDNRTGRAEKREARKHIPMPNFPLRFWGEERYRESLKIVRLIR